MRRKLAYDPSVPVKDPDHWLYRLTSDEWLHAAENELERARAQLSTKHQRGGVAGTRRAAGMALNAVLAVALDESYGRSYMDHLKTLARDASVPEAIRMAAQSLLDAPLEAQLVQLGRGDTHLADAAQAIVEHARQRVAPKIRG
jgi:HEPN domain-containing protein